ncbi:hypothetical protein DFS34DRAFT_613367 [Phlyctochytrium arcticum]|nr:hypothetical protein DFS34DRAFT_613367 [Phlyctochytrium arcticum]
MPNEPDGHTKEEIGHPFELNLAKPFQSLRNLTSIAGAHSGAATFPLSGLVPTQPNASSPGSRCDQQPTFFKSVFAPSHPTLAQKPLPIAPLNSSLYTSPSVDSLGSAHTSLTSARHQPYVKGKATLTKNQPAASFPVPSQCTPVMVGLDLSHRYTTMRGTGHLPPLEYHPVVKMEPPPVTSHLGSPLPPIDHSAVFPHSISSFDQSPRIWNGGRVGARHTLFATERRAKKGASRVSWKPATSDKSSNLTRLNIGSFTLALSAEP